MLSKHPDGTCRHFENIIPDKYLLAISTRISIFFSNSHSLLMINRVSLQSVNHSLEKINKKTHKLYFGCILNSYCKRLFLCSLYSENFFFYSDVQWFTSHHLIRFVTLIKRNKIERGIPQNVVQWKLDNFPLLNRSFLIK